MPWIWQHQNFDQKLGNARQLVAAENVSSPAVVDEMDVAAHRQYGSLPNMVSVIDKAGNIAYKDTLTMAEKSDTVMAELTDEKLVLPETAVGAAREKV